MKYKIIVDKQSRTNPSADKKEYIIDIEELRAKGDTYDSLVITKTEDYVMRRLKLTEFYVLEELEEPIKEPLKNINIELFEGDNYIYLIDMVGNKFYAEYLIKNDFNDIYTTKSEMHSAIELTTQNINLSVNRKLQNYSTTEEMNSSINAKASEINAEVEKKVNEETITGAYLILKINGDTSESKLNSDKIELSANDILNLLAGNAINLTTKNITISSNNFTVDKNGNMECNNGKFKGNIFLENGKKVIGGDGLLTNLHFETSDMYSGFSIIGFSPDWDYSSFKKKDAMLCVTIPENFIVTQAYISLNYSAIDGYDNNNSPVIGRPNQIKLYYSKSKAIGALAFGYGGGYFNDCANLYGTQIVSGSFIAAGVTDTTITTTELKTLKTANIKNIINSGNYVFYAETATTTSSTMGSASSTTRDALSKTFRGKLILDVIGYMN